MEPDKPKPKTRHPSTMTREEITSAVEEVSMLCCEGKYDECIEKGEALLENSYYGDLFGLSPWDKLRLHLVLSNYYQDLDGAKYHLFEAEILWSIKKQTYAPGIRPDIDNYLGILREELDGIAAVLEDDEVEGSQEDDGVKGSQDGEGLEDSQEDDNEAMGGSDVPQLIEHAEQGLRQLDLSSGEDIAPQKQHGTSLVQITDMEPLPSGMHGRTASPSMSLGSDTTITISPLPTLPIGHDSTSPTPNVEAILLDRVLQAEARTEQLVLRIAELEERSQQDVARYQQDATRFTAEINRLNLRLAEIERRAQQDQAYFNTERQHFVALSQRHAQERALHAQEQAHHAQERARDAAIVAELQQQLQDQTAL